MKAVILLICLSVSMLACTNNADNQGTGVDSSNTVILPAGRSSDSLAVPNDTMSSSPADSTAMKSDTMNH